MPKRILLWLVLLLGIIVIIAAQFYIPTLFEADGYLHIRIAKFIRQYGLRYNFHWTRYSVFANNFADKDLLYHVLLIPFTFAQDIFRQAKYAACLFSIALYLTFFFILKRYCLKNLMPWFLAMFFLSPDFLITLSRVRPMVIIFVLTLLFAHFLINKNLQGLFLVSLAYTLTHVSSPYLLLFAGLGEGVRFLYEREFSKKVLLAVFLGLATGFLIHPNFPNNFLIFYLNGIMVPIFALKWGLELGAEFFPTQTRTYVLAYPFLFLGVIFLAAIGTSANNKITLATRIWLAITAFFFVFSFFSQRYLSHCYTLLLVALASYIKDWHSSSERMVFLKSKPRLKAAAVVVAALLFGLIGRHTFKVFRQDALNEMVFNQHYENIGKWMASNIPAGEVVFHSNWSDSQYFIGLNPQDDYFVTLDPIYMYYWNPQKYNLYRDISFGRTADPYTLLQNAFGVRYGYVGKNYFSGLINQIRADTRFEVLGEDGLGLVFRMR